MRDAPFSGFDAKTMQFYHRILSNVMLNLHAVRMGYFNTLLCETDDPTVAAKWLETRHDIARIIREKNQRDAAGGDK